MTISPYQAYAVVVGALLLPPMSKSAKDRLVLETLDAIPVFGSKCGGKLCLIIPMSCGAEVAN